MNDNGLDLGAARTFPSLVRYLRDELDWPIESDDVEDLTFGYEPEELGLDAKTAAKINRDQTTPSPRQQSAVGVFFINFEPKEMAIAS